MGKTPKQVKYRQQYVRCGKPKCGRCTTGPGHGPYWYAIWRDGDHVRTRYVGKQLPPDVSTASLRGDLTQLAPVGTAPARRAQLAADILTTASATLVPPTTSIHIRMLGQFRVERNGALLSTGVWRRRAANLLLKMLVLADKHRLSRDTAVNYLWPGTSPIAARPKLASSIYALRRALEPDLLVGQLSRYISFDGQAITLHLGEADVVDVLSFESRLDRAAQAADPLPDLHAAMTIYGGDLLPGEHAPWCSARREALRLRWHAGLLALAEAQAGRRQYDAACATLGRLVHTNPALEEASRRLMILLAQQGRRADALRLYQRLERSLHADGGRAPEEATIALAASLHEGDPLPSTQSVRRTPPVWPARPSTTPPPLVGRSLEIERIRADLEATREGRGKSRILVLKGAAGIGKTRLAHDAVVMAMASGYTVLHGSGNEDAQDLPYAALAEPLGLLFSTPPAVATPGSIQGAEMVLELFPGPDQATPRTSGTNTRNGSGAERLRVWNVIVAALRQITATQPLLLVFENLQWFDAQSLGLLTYVLQQVAETRILILGTMRGALPPAHPTGRLFDALGDDRACIIDVPPLSRDAVAQLATGLLGITLTPAQSMALHAQCGGNPLFVTEFLALVGRQHEPERRHDMLAQLLADDTQWPTTLHQVIDRRLTHLNPECRTILEVGAVIGEHLSCQVLARVVHRQEQEIAQYLQEAIDAAILVSHTSGDPNEYAFVHDLVRHTLYTGLPYTYRQRLHAQVAAVLAEHTTIEKDPPTEQIARHFALSQNHFAAALWLERAGDRAVTMHAETEGAAHYMSAIQRLRRHQEQTGGDNHKEMAERLEGKLKQFSPAVAPHSTLAVLARGY
jgi:DNA-binding SARP family transcriptional activator